MVEASTVDWSRKACSP